jgi:hypothetical protein
MIQTRGGTRKSERRARPGPSLAAFPELATYVYRTPGRPSNRAEPRSASPAMQATALTRILRSAVMVILAGGSIAGALAFGAWHLLPYDAWKAATFAERFAIWEGGMWGLGMAGTLFGVAALFNATDLSGPRLLEQVQQQASDARRGRTLYSDLPALPWIVLSCGASLLLIAVIVRAVAFRG